MHHGLVDWGPNRLRGALALTFDNLSEPGVEDVVPLLLDRLDALALRATFCVEGVNCGQRPELVGEIDARGHELACHGWRHEHWAGLAAREESGLLARAREAFATLGVDVRGFRPPGGRLTADSERLLVQHGYCWCSPEGESYTTRDGLVLLPFRWALVDAAYFLPDLRSRVGLGSEPADAALGAAFDRALAELVTSGGQVTAILHPFLLLARGSAAPVESVLERIGELAASRGAWVAPAGDVAHAVAAG